MCSEWHLCSHPSYYASNFAIMKLSLCTTAIYCCLLQQMYSLEVALDKSICQKCYGSPILASTPTSLSSRDTPFTLLCAPSRTGRTAFRLSGVPPRGYRALASPNLRQALSTRQTPPTSLTSLSRIPTFPARRRRRDSGGAMTRSQSPHLSLIRNHRQPYKNLAGTPLGDRSYHKLLVVMYGCIILSP